MFLLASANRAGLKHIHICCVRWQIYEWINGTQQENSATVRLILIGSSSEKRPLYVLKVCSHLKLWFFFYTTQLDSEETASCFSCLLTPLTSILFSAVFEQQARQEGHVDRLRDPRQGVDLHGLLLVVCSTRESF